MTIWQILEELTLLRQMSVVAIWLVAMLEVGSWRVSRYVVRHLVRQVEKASGRHKFWWEDSWRKWGEDVAKFRSWGIRAIGTGAVFFLVVYQLRGMIPPSAWWLMAAILPGVSLVGLGSLEVLLGWWFYSRREPPFS